MVFYCSSDCASEFQKTCELECYCDPIAILNVRSQVNPIVNLIMNTLANPMILFNGFCLFFILMKPRVWSHMLVMPPDELRKCRYAGRPL